MEVLETAQVDIYSAGDVVLYAENRSDVLCVVWDGTCVEQERQTTTEHNPGARCVPITLLEDSDDGKCNDSYDDDDSTGTHYNGALSVWHAGDWTGPHSLQAE